MLSGQATPNLGGSIGQGAIGDLNTVGRMGCL